MKKQLKIEYIPIGDIKPNEYNPKILTEKEEKDLEKSIVKFGIVDPLIINIAKGREGIIIGGHQRYRVYRKLNFGEVPEYDEWLSIANRFQNPKGTNIMIFENWRNTRELWNAMEKYWKIKNLIIEHLPSRHQGFSRPYLFFNKYDIAPLAGEGKLNEEYEEELENYLKEKGQKLLDTYEIILYAQQGDSEWFGKRTLEEKTKKGYYQKVKRSKWAKIADHITWTEASSGQNIVFGTKPIQILVPYIKILSPRNGIVMDCFAGSFSTGIACEIMHRKCRAIEIEPIYAEVCINRWERFSGKRAQKIN